jgi:hypothetical protein
MKALKISLAIIVVTAVTFFVIRSLIPTPPPPPPPPPENQAIEQIEREINLLKTKPDSEFCKDFYNRIAFHIDSDFEEGRLGESPSDISGNRQNKESLMSDLYYAYANKFIHQAFYVFSHLGWRIEDLNFIRNEYQTLRKSNLLEKGSLEDNKFTEIQNILSKYDEIDHFIFACKRVSCSSFSISNHFPISDVRSKVSQAATYRNNLLRNEYFKHCTRLLNELENVPQILFNEHVRYLNRKINEWSGFYPNFNSHSDYVNILNQPLSREITALNNNIYNNVTNFASERQRLLDRWSEDNRRAYNHNYQTNN